jgi:YD repeat-containing protein
MRSLLIALALAVPVLATAQRHAERTFDEQGRLVTSRYEKDGREFVFTYHANGRLAASQEYVGGVRDGLWKQYDEHGHLLVRACFDQGRRCGTWEFFSQAGTLRGRLTYFDGALAGGEAFDPAGALLEARAY